MATTARQRSSGIAGAGPTQPIVGGSGSWYTPLRLGAVIVITGPGRSGTSVLARLYQELGFDPGGNWIPDKRAGLEHGDFWRLNNKLAAAAGFTMPHSRKRDSSRPAKVRMVKWDRVDGVVAEHAETMVRLARENAVVKDPRFQWTLPLWLRAGAQIDFVVITVR